MVERCVHCGAVLRPHKIITAYHGKLFCSNKCCSRYVANTEFKNNIDMFNNGGYERINKAASKRVNREGERINSSDVGIEYPRCPFNSGFCDGKCALDINGRCAIAIIATNK